MTAQGAQGPVQNGMDTQGGGQEAYMDHQTPSHIRNDFVKKVYSILSFQLLLTTAIGYYISQQPSQWIRGHFYVFHIAAAMTMCTLLGVSCCCAQVARQFPVNYAFLAVVTIGIGTTTGFAASMYT